MTMPRTASVLLLLSLALGGCSSTTSRVVAVTPSPAPVAVSAPAPEAAPPVIEAAPEPTFDAVLATYDTRYKLRGRYRGRAHNVELAASKVDGTVIPPGGVFSFNDAVGARTRRAGFRVAPVINDGVLTDGMGGGVCQVASTLFAASYHAGLDIVEQRPHSRPSTYIELGMDATVVWPDVDLKIHNPYSFPIEVHATAERGQLSVELRGDHVPAEVQVSREVLSRASFGEREMADATLPVGARVVEQEGIRGARVRRTRVVRDDGGAIEEVSTVVYPPTDRVVRVGTGATQMVATAQ